MKSEHYFHNCSQEYINSIDADLFSEIVKIVSQLPKREMQAEINQDLFWLLTARGWSYDTVSAGLPDTFSKRIEVEEFSLSEIKKANNRALCRTTTTIEATWHSDFGKRYASGLVQVEAQFGKVESMFKDFCGFRITNYEKRLALGIEIVLCEPLKYFSHRKNAVGGMAYFDIAKRTLPAVGLDCPIWLLGIKG